MKYKISFYSVIAKKIFSFFPKPENILIVSNLTKERVKEEYKKSFKEIVSIEEINKNSVECAKNNEIDIIME